MKISFKIFIFTYCLIMLTTIFGGFLLINYEYQNNLNQAKQTTLDNNKTMYTYISATGEMLGSASAEYSLEQFIQRLDTDENEIFLGEISELSKHISLGSAKDLESEEYCYSFVSKDNKTFIQVISKYKTQYIINYHDISGIMAQRDENYLLYRNIIICISVIIAAVLYLFSWYITRPLTKVTKMAETLSAGNYSARIDSSYTQMKSFEVEQLGNTLNQMADHIETYIEKIQMEAQRKEDFIGNFTHELKTPMTSIIGYADLLRTYNLSPDKQREYSNYIYMEAKRIEQLAVNLLQLIVMQKEQFPFEQISVAELVSHLKSETHFLGEKYDVTIQFDFEAGEITGEKSLLIVGIKNLIDNACKAS
ncbi:MAG: HAMP domain-containing histidine kinase, partial [Treponema sp.]|nr:HAMP domain-containing histidine kinase [Treponema sp.]